MKNVIWFSVLVFYLFTDLKSALCQPLGGIVLNERTMQGIPYTIITNTRHTAYTIADSTGRFQIADVAPFDSLEIRSIGFKKVTIPVPKIMAEVLLEESPILLDNLTVVKAPRDVHKLGAVSPESEEMFGGYMNDDFELALFIPNSQNQVGILKCSHFFGQPKDKVKFD